MSEEAREIFKENFRKILEARDLTQADVAKALGYTASTVSDWGKGKSYPRVDRMQKLAEYLRVPMAYLTTRKNIDDLPSLLSDDEQKLVRAYRQATDAAREIAMETLMNHPRKQDVASAS